MKTDPNHHPHRSKAIRRVIFTVFGAAALLGAVIGARAGLERLRDEDTVAIAVAETNISTAVIRDLNETFTATGTLRYDEAIEITAPTGGTALDIIEAGTSLDNGDIIAVVDDQAIVWLDGEIPAWRALSVGDEGVDVLQLEIALAALGFNGDNDVTIDEEYTAATAAMVEDWQASIGIEPTGRVDLGMVVFGGARNRVASVAVAVGDNVSDGAALIALGTNNRNALLDAAPGEAVTLAIGDAASITLPDRSDLAGTITAIAAGSETWQITVVFPQNNRISNDRRHQCGDVMDARHRRRSAHRSELVTASTRQWHLHRRRRQRRRQHHSDPSDRRRRRRNPRRDRARARPGGRGRVAVSVAPS